MSVKKVVLPVDAGLNCVPPSSKTPKTCRGTFFVRNLLSRRPASPTPSPIQSSPKKSDGSIVKESFLNAYEVTSSEHEVQTLDELYAHIVHHASRGECMLKGQLARALRHESRAGSTNPDGHTSWVCLDFDGISSTAHSRAIARLRSARTPPAPSCSGAPARRIMNTDLRCHVFMPDAPRGPLPLF